jgi:hypothetical protein
MSWPRLLVRPSRGCSDRRSRATTPMAQERAQSVGKPVPWTRTGALEPKKSDGAGDRPKSLVNAAKGPIFPHRESPAELREGSIWRAKASEVQRLQSHIVGGHGA